MNLENKVNKASLNELENNENTTLNELGKQNWQVTNKDSLNELGKQS